MGQGFPLRCSALHRRSRRESSRCLQATSSTARKSLTKDHELTDSIDDKVPIRQSQDVVDACKVKGLDVTFEVLEGVDHLFDMDAKYTLDGMYAWITKLVQ